MRSVNVAELKNRLSAYLQEVRAGEELVIRDRNLPVARIVPIESGDLDPDEASLVASGLMRLPKRPLDFERFWAIGGRARRNAKTLKAISQAIELEREEKDVRLLGPKRNHPHLRSRPGK